MKKTEEKVKEPAVKVTLKSKDVDTGKTQGSETKKAAVEPTIEDKHPATHNKHVVVPDTEDNEITPPETLKTDVQNESTKPAVATNIPKFEHTEDEVVSEKGEHLDKSYGGVAEDDADEKNKAAETNTIIEPIKTEEQAAAEQESMEEQIVKYIESRKTSEIKLNDFLKSLFPPKANEPAAYLNQGASKQIKKMLGDLQGAGKISLVDGKFENLGKGYYVGEQHQLKHHDITTVDIIAKK